MSLTRRVFEKSKSISKPGRQGRSRQPTRRRFISRLGLELLEPRRLMAVVATELPRYDPGSTVDIVTREFSPGATVEFSVVAAGADSSTAQRWQVADGSELDLDATVNGSIASTWKLPKSAVDGQVYNVNVRDLCAGEAAATQVTADDITSRAFVQSDKSDYQPMETAIITAGGFQPGEAVEFQVLHIDGRSNTGAGHTPWQVIDGSPSDQDGVADGNLTTSWYVHEDDSLGAVFSLTASGQASGIDAQSSFTDGDDFMATPTTGSVYFGDNFDGALWSPSWSYYYQRWFGEYYRSSTGPISPFGTHAIGLNGNRYEISSRGLDISDALSVSLTYEVQPGGNWEPTMSASMPSTQNSWQR